MKESLHDQSFHVGTWDNFLTYYIDDVLLTPSLSTEEFGKYKVESAYKMEDVRHEAKNEGSEVRTRADKRPTDLKSAALDHSAIPPIILFKCYMTSLS